MSGDEKYQEGDDICKSCTGLLIFTAERKKRGLRPLCVGVPGVAKGRVPKNRVLELNERTKGKLGTYVLWIQPVDGYDGTHWSCSSLLE